MGEMGARHYDSKKTTPEKKNGKEGEKGVKSPKDLTTSWCSRLSWSLVFRGLFVIQVQGFCWKLAVGKAKYLRAEIERGRVREMLEGEREREREVRSFLSSAVAKSAGSTECARPVVLSSSSSSPPPPSPLTCTITIIILLLPNSSSSSNERSFTSPPLFPSLHHSPHPTFITFHT